MPRTVLSAVALVFLLAGCSAASESASAVSGLSAEQAVTELAGIVPSAEPGVVFTAETDPNDLLGRPGGYESKASFADSRIPPSETLGYSEGAVELGGSVEVFANADAARQRMEYIQSIGPPLANEYDYVSGPVLLRVTGKLPPKQAGEYETALARIG